MGGTFGGAGDSGQMWGKYYKESMGSTGNILGGLSAYAEAKKNADFADTRLKNALREGANNAFLRRRFADRRASAMAASYGARGVDVNQGSPVNILAGMEADGEVSALRALYAGELEAANWNAAKKAAKQRGGTALLGVGVNVADPMNMYGGRDAFWGNYLRSGGGTFMGGR